MKKQVMKFPALRRYTRIFTLALPLALSLAAVLSLGGCDGMTMLGRNAPPKYKTLDSGVAAMAAPGTPAPGPAGREDGGAGGARRLYCRVGNGSAHFGRHWYDYDSDDFLLEQGTRVTVTLTARKGKGTMSFVGFFDDAGQKMIFCPVVKGPPDKRIPCTSLYALDDDLALGIRRTFDLPHAVRGANITCAFRRDKLRKL